MEKKWWQKEVVYQIYPRSFYDSNDDGIGDISGIIEKLGYLKELGITMIWICPIFQSPMDDNGYDISDYYHLAPEFGTNQELEELIKKANAKGIKVLLDLVLNHTSDEHHWFQEALKDPSSRYHDYYIFKEGKEPINNWRSVFGGSVWQKVEQRDEMYMHCFSKKQPDLNWENPLLREELYKMVTYWLEKGISGFRVDAITFIKKDLQFASVEPDGVDGLSKCTKTCRNQPGIEKFLNELNERCFSKYDCMTVAEAAGVEYHQLEDFVGERGFFSMIFDFKHADLDVASGSEWFKRKDWSVKDLKNLIMHSQMEMQKAGWAANFIENHDQPRATTKYLKEAHTNKDAVKMLGAMYFFLRGTPYIYQGQELGMTNFNRTSIDQFNDISAIDQYYRSMDEGCTKEEALHYMNLRSRDNARTPFPWDDSDHAGFSKVTPWLSVTENYQDINAKQQLQDPCSVLSFYQKMITLRQTGEYSEVLTYGKIEVIDVDDEVISYSRKDNQKIVECYFNMSSQPKEISTDKQKVVFENMETVWTNKGISLQPYHAVIIE